ncbi:MAG: ABC transporter transmembrane domain-containing protein [Candidatus Omnitrophota bacterium]|nr:ATP-binding cassette domain-containing protein [Candidatus Omnitrophota bacterium]
MKEYWKEYFKLLRLVKPFKGKFILAGICMAFSAVFDGVSLGMILPVIDRIFTNKTIIIPDAVRLPHFAAVVVDKLNTTDALVILKILPFFVMGLFLLKGVFYFMQSCLMNMIAQGVVRDVKDKLYAKFQELSLEFYAKKRTGELIARITNDVSFIANALSYALTDLIYESMQAIVFGTITFYLGRGIFSWKLLTVFIIFPLILVPVARLGKRIKKFSLEIQKKVADLTSILAETIQGAYIVKVFCREDYELARFKAINQQYYKYTLKSIKRIIVMAPLTEFFGALGAVVVVAVVGPDVLSGKISFGAFGLFMAALMSMIRPFKKISNVHAINQQAIPASNRIYDILDEEPKIKEASEAVAVSEIHEKIVFDNIWFTYSLDDDYVLREINLTARCGQVIALVGHSGAGKSTLVSLLPRLYDPQQGRILFDDLDVRQMQLRSLRSLISIVSQDMVLFNATVRDNIAYGRDGAAMNDIESAAKRAFAYDFINNFPQKFDTVIGDRGMRLSGGEKQRIAIARAMLKDAPILILDEATSQLDSASEGLIQEALGNLMKGKTVFVIAHRLSTVQNADKILVMEKGKIIETGTHAELLARPTTYKKLYDLQFNV